MARQTPRHRAERPSWFGHGRTRALLSAGMLVGVGAVGTSAYWNAGATVPGVAVTAGTIHIDLATNNKVKPETYPWTDMNGSLSTAGQSQAKILRVRNNSTGGLTFGYSLAATATNPAALGGQLKITVRRNGSISGTTCTGGTLIGTAGAALNGFNQPMGSLSSTQGTPYHDVCVQVSLLAGSGVANGATSAITFTFPATQVVS